MESSLEPFQPFQPFLYFFHLLSIYASDTVWLADTPWYSDKSLRAVFSQELLAKHRFFPELHNICCASLCGFPLFPDLEYTTQ